jgi:hypothetical protein
VAVARFLVLGRWEYDWAARGRAASFFFSPSLGCALDADFDLCQHVPAE